ncbi:MAG: lipoprotein signal peptidase [Rhodothermaceae bacterium]|nr:MAG: lipoprotein signal peptidase [Rhodothermaceae bacterium]
MRALWITLAVVLVDQATKIVVLNTMMRHESIPILGDWLRLTFTENPGMAFGITFGPPVLVTVFSIVATALIIFYMVKIGRAYFPYRASLALVLGGAIGNIIDRVFYGVILGYDGLFLGRVVDFIHVNLWRGYIPEAIPLVGGSYIALFPIWNVADMAIVLGVVGILVFQRTFHERLAALQGQAETPPRDEEEAAALAMRAVTRNGMAPAATEDPAVEEERDGKAPTS